MKDRTNNRKEERKHERNNNRDIERKKGRTARRANTEQWKTYRQIQTHE